MAHSIPPLIELNDKYNKVIRVGKSNKQFADFKASRDRSTFTNIDGDVLDKPIQVYRMWYRFLQLALELERQKVNVVAKMQKRELKTPKKDRWGKLQRYEMVPVKRPVKVNKKKYTGWDIETIPETSFNDWWFGDKKNYPAHKDLFYPDKSLVVLKKKDEWVEDKNFTYIRIDNRRRINDIEKDLRSLFADADRKIESVSAFPIFGTPNINTLINRYNAMILQLTTTMTDKEMLNQPIFRPTQYGMGTETNEGETAQLEEGVYQVGSYGEGRVMRDLMLPAKITLLSVCDGFFVKNPNKDYV